MSVQFLTITLSGFGLYREPVRLMLTPGINVFVGGNETGKSTLSAGLAALIYGMPAAADPRVFGQARYRNWYAPSRFAGELEFLAGQSHYRLRRNFDNHRVSLHRRLQGKWVEEAGGEHNPAARKINAAYEAAVEKLFGITNRDLFMATYYVAQPLPEGEQVLPEIQRLLSGSGSHYGEALRSLLAALKDLTRYTARLGVTAQDMRQDRELEQTDKEIMKTEAAISLGAKTLEQWQRTVELLNQAKEERTAKAAELSEKERLLTAWLTWQSLRSRYLEASARQSSLAAAANHAGMLAGRIAKREIELGEKVEANRLKLQQMLSVAQKSGQKRKKAQAAAFVAGLFVMAALVLGGQSPALAGTISLLAGLTAWLLWRLVWRAVVTGQHGITETADTLEFHTKERERLAELNRQKEHDEKELSGILLGHGVSGLAELQRLAADAANRAVGILASWENLIQANPGLPGNEPADPVLMDSQYRQLAAQTEELRQDVAVLDAKILEAEFSRARLLGQSPPNIAEQHERLRSLVTGRERLKREAAALQTAYQELTAAVNQFTGSSRQLLADKTTEYFCRITGLAGRDIHLDEEFRIRIVQDGNSVVMAQLSQGARDQLYLSLRLAVADLLAGDIRLPFIFDDPFVTWDQSRLARMRRTVAALARDRQVLILTHREEITAWGHVCKIQPVGG